jgi:hypothetical protein
MRRSRTVKTTVALALAATALAPAAASARPAVESAAPTGAHTRIVRVPQTQIVRPAQDGFDWADASIGGAGVLGLMLVTGGGLAATRRRAQGPHRSAAGAL